MLNLPFEGKSSSLMMKKNPQSLSTGVSETTINPKKYCNETSPSPVMKFLFDTVKEDVKGRLMDKSSLYGEEKPPINQIIVDCSSFFDVDEDGNFSNLSA